MAEPVKEAPKPAEEEKVFPAELKKRAKAEKQARRATQKEADGAPSGPPAANSAPTGEGSLKQQGEQK
jgi:translation initiation factor eIF-2B subunit delta